MVRARRVAAAALAVAAAACTGAAPGIGIATSFNVALFPVGDRAPAPPFTGEALPEGAPVSSDRYAGAVGVVNFWGTWCGPCRREQPALEALWKEYRDRGVSFIGVNTRRDQRAAALAYLEEFAVTYPAIFDPDSRIAHAFRVRAMPATFVVDRQGRIAAAIFGALRNEGDLRTVLDAELAR